MHGLNWSFFNYSVLKKNCYLPPYLPPSFKENLNSLEIGSIDKLLWQNTSELHHSIWEISVGSQWKLNGISSRMRVDYSFSNNGCSFTRNIPFLIGIQREISPSFTFLFSFFSPYPHTSFSCITYHYAIERLQ